MSLLIAWSRISIYIYMIYYICDMMLNLFFMLYILLTCAYILNVSLAVDVTVFTFSTLCVLK